MTNSEKQMAKELYELVEEGERFSQWEMNFIGRLAHLPYHYHLSCRQQEILQSLWDEHIGYPQQRRCVYPIHTIHYLPPQNDSVLTREQEAIRKMGYKIRELESAIDRLTNGQSKLFRDAEDIEEFFIDLNNRVVELEVEQ